MASRNEIFQRLKPHCIQLSKDALTLTTNNNNVKAVVASLEILLRELRSIQRQHGDLDGKIAEYCFFPLSHILEASQKLPGQALESTLECLIVLLETGWQRDVPKDLALQLMILLSFLGATPKSSQTSEELQEAALRCMVSLFGAFAKSSGAKDALLSTEHIPHMGNCVSVMLDSIDQGRSNEIQLAASQSLGAFFKAVTHQQALASFLPGIVSSLAKCLTPTTKLRRSYRVVQTNIQNMETILQLVLSDSRTDALPQEATSHNGSHELTQTWLRASASQIKQALSNVVRQRSHEREEVRMALDTLCRTVLEKCRKSLADCAEMMMDTLIVLAQVDVRGDAKHSLRILLQTQPDRADLLKSMLHNWITSLPRIMTSHNDSSKTDVLGRVSSMFRLLREERLTLDKVDQILATNLRDCLAMLIREGSQANTANAAHSSNKIGEVALRSFDPASAQFESVIGVKSQEQTISALHALLKQLSTTEVPKNLVRELLTAAQNAKGEFQLASFWLAKVLIECTPQDEFRLADFIEVDDESLLHMELKEDLYALSLAILIDSTSELDLDHRLQCLSLEVVAFQARSQGTDFRSELIETLYPMLHLMGSTNDLVRNHAITCVNIVSNSTGYASASDMIVENADYLVNAVGLKLNSFELSPQAPQVLLMMIKVSGPSLLPYLEDLVSSMFSALESFHGYPTLVELLFGVFRAITEEGVKVPALAVLDQTSSASPSIHGNPPSVQEVAEHLKELREHLDRSRVTEEEPKLFPEEAWNSNAADQGGADEGHQGQAPSQDDPPPPSPKTYSLLLRIAQLTQHYLPSSSPTLRTSLLSLLNSTIPALAVHENSFLPLINTLWPVLVPRLEDPEAFIVSNTMEVISLMCHHGGNFMKGRINDIWPALIALDPRRRVSSQNQKSTNAQDVRHALSKDRTSGATSREVSTTKHVNTAISYVDLPSRMIWKSFVELLKTIVSNITVDEAKYEDIMLSLEPLWGREDVRLALEAYNPDAF